MNGQYLDPRLELIAGLTDLLLTAAYETARKAHQRYRFEHRPRRGKTLRPGADTPLWNELAGLVRLHVRRHGQKVLLARHLGLPRQRIHEFLKVGAAMPDAERTLELMGWLAARTAPPTARRAKPR